MRGVAIEVFQQASNPLLLQQTLTFTPPNHFLGQGRRKKEPKIQDRAYPL
jgi:hypothetical protein